MTFAETLNSGLNYFAEDSDRRRSNIAVTLMQMAAVVTILLVTLLPQRPETVAEQERLES